MNCATCQGNSEKTTQCFLKALDTIKKHFFMMQELCKEKGNINSQLSQRNEKLHDALDMLRQGQEMRTKSSPKRRRLTPKKPSKQLGRHSTQSTDKISPLVPESQDSLNMNIALQSDDDEEIITETEPAISPYKPWSSRRKLNTRNSENEQPTSTTITTDTSNAWLGKVPRDKLPLNKIKMSLTVRGDSPRLKQTRLHFDGSMANNAVEKDVIESSPNLYSSLKDAKKSRSLLQRADNSIALDVRTTGNSALKPISNNNCVFDMDDDESIFNLCPDPSIPLSPTSYVDLHPLSGTSDTSSVMLLTPATQDIVFIDDSITENLSLNTMDFMEEAIKEDDKVSLTRLQKFEAELIRKRQIEATVVKAKPDPINIKDEPLTELPSDLGNESTKLPEDFEIEGDEQEEEEIFPRPIVVKQEQEMSVKERYNINCVQCEKFITFMGTNLNDEKIQMYLNNCRHEREDHNTPAGFWNPHMVSFSEDDPRNKIHVDRRFVDQRKK